MKQSFRSISVYFAGKVYSRGGYRGRLFHTDVMLAEHQGKEVCRIGDTAILYAGPTALGTEGKTTTLPATHGCGFVKDNLGHATPNEVKREYDEEFLVGRCLGQIAHADAVFVYMEALDCYGTLAEIGYAVALGKPIYLIIADYLQDDLESKTSLVGMHGEVETELWFVCAMPRTESCFGKESEFFTRAIPWFNIQISSPEGDFY